MVPRHAAPGTEPWYRRKASLRALVVAAAVVLATGGASAGYAARTMLAQPTVDCSKPISAPVAPDGSFTVTLTCIGPPPATSPSPTASPTPSPTATATPSPSPTATTTTTPPPTTTPPATTPPATTPPVTTPPVTTPPATTPPGTRLLNCFTQLAACGYPTQTNTGVPAGAVLTKHNGDLNIRTGGTWTNLDITGCINITTTQPVILRNIRVTPANPDQGCGQGNINHQGGGTLLVEDTTSYCTIAAGHGFWVANTTARRIQTYGCVNGFELNENSVVVDSWISSSENGPRDPHGDDIQSQGGNNVLVQHNTFAGVNPITSSIITNPTLNNGWTIENNFLSSGAYTLYCSKQGTGWTVRNNRFYPAATGNPHSAAYGLTDACNRPSAIAWSGNFNDSNGRTVNANGATV